MVETDGIGFGGSFQGQNAALRMAEETLRQGSRPGVCSLHIFRREGCGVAICENVDAALTLASHTTKTLLRGASLHFFGVSGPPLPIIQAFSKL